MNFLHETPFILPLVVSLVTYVGYIVLGFVQNGRAGYRPRVAFIRRQIGLLSLVLAIMAVMVGLIGLYITGTPGA